MRKPPALFGTRNAGLAYGDLLGRTTPCSKGSFTMVLKITSFGGAHLYGEERTRVGSDNSISYGAHLAVPNVDENNAENSAKIALPTPPGHSETCVKF